MAYNHSHLQHHHIRNSGLRERDKLLRSHQAKLVLILIFTIGMVEATKLGNVIFDTVAVAMQSPDNQEYWGWLMASLHAPPWTVWMVSMKGYTYLASPYSILWYLFYYPLASSPFFLYVSVFIIDLAFVAWSWSRYGRGFLMRYQIISVLSFPRPQNMLTVWTTTLGMANPLFLLLAPLTKFPVGSELMLGNWSVWNYVFHSPSSINDSSNWESYIFMALWWLFIAWNKLLNHAPKPPLVPLPKGLFEQ